MQPIKKCFKAATKENLQNLTNRIQIWKKTFADKVIKVVQLFVQPDGETYCCR